MKKEIVTLVLIAMSYAVTVSSSTIKVTTDDPDLQSALSDSKLTEEEAKEVKHTITEITANRDDSLDVWLIYIFLYIQYNFNK